MLPLLCYGNVESADSAAVPDASRPAWRDWTGIPCHQEVITSRTPFVFSHVRHVRRFVRCD